MKTRYFSLRKHLVLGIIGSTILILGTVGYATYWVLEHETDEIFKARLATSARVLEALITDQIDHRPMGQPISIALPANIETNSSVNSDLKGHEYERKIAFQVWNETGLLLAKSESAPDKPLAKFKEGSSNEKVDDEYWEVFALKSGGIWVLAAEHNEVLDEKTHKLALAISTPFVFGTVLLLLVVNWLLLSNLRPLGALAGKISSREPECLLPIHFEVAPLELKPIVDELNALLMRVDKAFKREQWFIDAAAHELRTPIAGLQLHIHNALRAESETERNASLNAATEGLRRTTRLAEQLLAFSRVAGATDPEEMNYLALDVVCKDVLESYKSILEKRGQTTRLSVDGECIIRAELGKIERLIQNLLDNAAKYGESPGVIEVSLMAYPDAIELIVGNKGSLIPDDLKKKIFEPYFRVLGSAAAGTGLGLAIAKQIVSQAGGTISVRDMNDGAGTEFIVRFPTT